MEKSRKNPNKKSRTLDIQQCVAKNLSFGATLKCKNIKLFAAIVKATSFVTNTEIQLSDLGLKYVVEESKSFQVIAYIQKEVFSDYFIKVPSALNMFSFGVNLNSFTDLLSGFIENDERSTMNISYFDRENRIVFCVIQNDAGAISRPKPGTFRNDDDDDVDDLAGKIRTEYFLRTMHSINPIDFNLENQDELHSIIINAPDFLNILNDFDRTITELDIKITQTRMTFRSIGILQYGSTGKYNSDSGIFDNYECHEPSQFIYRFSYFKVLMKGLALASKASITTQINGTMKIQLKVPSDDDPDVSAYIVYNMIPNLLEDEDEDE